MSPLDDDSARWLTNIAFSVAALAALGTWLALIWLAVKYFMGV